MEAPLQIDPFLRQDLSDTPLCMTWSVFDNISYLAMGLADGGLSIIAFQESRGCLEIISKWNEADAHDCGIQDSAFCQVGKDLYLSTGIK